MNVSLTPELEALVSSKLDSGGYGSASEVIREGLRLLVERDELIELRKDELRRQVAAGIDQAERGELIDGPEAIADVRKRIQARRNAQK